MAADDVARAYRPERTMSLSTVICCFCYLLITPIHAAHEKGDKQRILSCLCNVKGVTPCWVENGTDFYQLEKGQVLKNRTGKCSFTTNGHGTSRIPTCTGISHPKYDVILLACGHASSYADVVECSVKKNSTLSTCWCSHYNECNGAIPSMLKMPEKGMSPYRKSESFKRQSSSSTLELLASKTTIDIPLQESASVSKESELTTTRAHLTSDSTSFSSELYAPQILGAISFKNLVSPAIESNTRSENEPSTFSAHQFFDDVNSTVLFINATKGLEKINVTILSENTTMASAALSLSREVLAVFTLFFVLFKVFG